MRKWLILEIIFILLALVGLVNLVTASTAPAGAPEANAGTDVGVMLFWGLLAFWANKKRTEKKSVVKD